VRRYALFIALTAPMTAFAQQAPKPVLPRENSWNRIERSTFEVGATVGLQMQENAFGGRNGAFNPGVSVGWLYKPWLELQGIADFAIQRERPADLSITNTATFLGGGPVLGVWLEFVRLFVEGAAGPVVRTLAFDDAGEFSGTAARLSFAWQFGGGMGVVIGGRFGFAIRALGRFHDDRSNLLLAADFSWFFGPD